MNNFHYAGFWIRTLATIIDALILTFILAVPLTFIYGMNYWLSDTLIKGFWDVVINYIVPVFLTIWLWLMFKATPGKMLLGLEVVDAETGEKMTLRQAVIRYFSYIPSMLVFMAGFFWIAFDKRKQGWHDRIAKTIVISKSNKFDE